MGINTIAHSLSQQCRFNGHTSHFYSVAEHSIHCSHLVEPQFAYAALMHDAGEAFVSDIVRPLKLRLSEIKEYEERCEAVLFEHYGVPNPLPKEVWTADVQMFSTERYILFPHHQLDDWEIPEPDLQMSLPCWHPELAKKKFLDRYAELVSHK